MSGARQADAHLIYQMRQLDIYVRLTTHSVNFLCVMGKIQGVNDAVTQLNGNAGHTITVVKETVTMAT